jgi:glycine cleavage system H protein
MIEPANGATMMSDILETTIDKFTFQVRTGYRYSRDDLWVRPDDGLATVGLTDLLQRRSGDVAFVELPAAGQQVTAGAPCGTLETIKATQDIPSPLSGTVTAVNEELGDRPELINQDPYGQGWLFQIMPADPPAAGEELLDAQDYFEWMRDRLEIESGELRG